MDQNGDGLVDLKELTLVLTRLDYRAKKSEARASLALSMRGMAVVLPAVGLLKRFSCGCQVEDMIWEVDEDCDTCVSWEEFQLMFERCSSDKARHPPTRQPSCLPVQVCMHVC